MTIYIRDHQEEKRKNLGGEGDNVTCYFLLVTCYYRMNHFHNAKIIATMGPAIDKETVLSKVINHIDCFRINLSHGDEEVKKRYVDIINKLDNSKSVLLDTRGPEIRTKNKFEIECKLGKTMYLKYAEFFKEEEDTIFVDYANLENIPNGTIISFDMDEVIVEVVQALKNEGFEIKVIR
jgi:pyruvate kinase